MDYSPTTVARLFLFVREASQNKGLRVGGIQAWGGGKSGDSWCCWFVTMILDICFQGFAPIPRGGSCQSVYALAQSMGWIVDYEHATVDDIFIYLDVNGVAHHIGFLTSKMMGPHGIAGNTSIDGKSVNGSGVYEHEISNGPRVKYIHYPRG